MSTSSTCIPIHIPLKWIHMFTLLFPPLSTLSRFEKGGQGRGVIQKQPCLAGLTFSLSETITWFEGLVAALDCYTWVLGEQLIAPSEVFQCRLMHTCICK